MPCVVMHATLRVSKKKYVLWCIPHDVAYHYFMQIWKSGVVLSFQVKNIDTLLILLTTLSWQVAYLTMQLEKNLMLCMKWVELHGDRAGCDDPTMVTYIGCIEGWSYLLIGHQKDYWRVYAAFSCLKGMFFTLTFKYWFVHLESIVIRACLGWKFHSPN